MKLIKEINISVFEVLADYRIQVKNSPFIPLLKFANENGGKITVEKLYNNLLKPLSEKACSNLLERLEMMGYFVKQHASDEKYTSLIKWMKEQISNNKNSNWRWALNLTLNIKEYEEKYRVKLTTETKKVLNKFVEDYNNFSEIKIKDYIKSKSNKPEFTLTELGKKSAEKEEFYEQRSGILRMYLVENELVVQKIVKIEEVRGYENFNEEELRKVNNTSLRSITSTKLNKIELNSNICLIDNLEAKCRVLREESGQMIIAINDNGSVLTLLDFETNFDENTESIKNIILGNNFNDDYDEDTKVLKTEFDISNLQLARDVKIDSPKFKNTVFNPLVIPNIDVIPKNDSDANLWYAELVKRRISKYFLSEKEFNDFTNEIAKEFKLYYPLLKGSVSKENLIKHFEVSKNFYKKSKLETIDYLNY